MEGGGVVPGPDGLVIALSSNVTAPFRAKALPDRLALVLSEMDARASMFPANEVEVPSVAELPTCQKTLAGAALLIRDTALPLAVVSVLPIWKINSALALPRALSVSVPVN